MASVAQFFFEGELSKGATIQLDEATARHIVQVLRKQPGDVVRLSNGNGYAATTTISDVAKKKCAVLVGDVEFHEDPEVQLHLAVAFTKNSSRNEWLLEKATELGVKSITPLVTTRTEKEHIRYDRGKGILVSAMLQSQGYYLPQLQQPARLKDVIAAHAGVPQKLIAHCMEGKGRKALKLAMRPGLATLVLIGPEGDFTEDEVQMCEENNFKAISMGIKRLRTETAAMTVCAYFNMVNDAE